MKSYRALHQAGVLPTIQQAPRHDVPSDQPDSGVRTDIYPHGDVVPGSQRTPRDEPDFRMPTVQVPRRVRLNRMYGTLRGEQMWRQQIDFSASGVTSLVAGASVVTAPATLDPKYSEQGFSLRLDQFPDAVQAHLCVRTFGCATATPVAGVAEMIFVDNGGIEIPLMQANAQTGEWNLADLGLLSPTPITDSGMTTFGQMLFIGQAIGVGGVTLRWRIGFSIAYLLPDSSYLARG